MAELNKEIIKEIIKVPKDNGQSIQLNIIKWGRNSSKYDLRVWDGEKSLKGFTLSEEELNRLCRAVTLKYSRYRERGEERTVFEIRQMNAIDLRSVLENHPESKDDYQRLRALLRDLYPQKTLEVNLILNVLHCGISGQMLRLKEVKTRDMKRFVNFLESQYGIRESCAAGAVIAWAKALDIPFDIETVLENKEPEKKTPTVKPKQPPKPVIGHKYGDIVFENEDISVTYKGVYRFNGLFAQGHRIRFFIENKTGQKLRISGKDIGVNGLVVKSEDLFNSEVAPHKKVIDTVLMPQSSLVAAGITKVTDMRELTIHFEYDNGHLKRRTSEIALVPYEVKE